MKISIESTPELITCNETLMRIWEGETESGAKVKCLIAAVIMNKNETGRNEFEGCLYLNPDPDLADLADINLQFRVDRAIKSILKTSRVPYNFSLIYQEKNM